MAISNELVDVIATREPETTAQGKSVVVTVPVVFANNPAIAAQVRLTLSVQQAEYLAAQIQPVLVTARVNTQRKK